MTLEFRPTHCLQFDEETMLNIVLFDPLVQYNYPINYIAKLLFQKTIQLRTKKMN